MANYKIFPYKVGSASVKKLKAALDAVIIKTENSKYRFKDGHTVINWGNSTLPDNLIGVAILNQPEAIAIAANKLATLEYLEDADVPHVEYTTDVDEAQAWLEEGEKVFARHKLNGHSGEGIEVIKSQINPELEQIHAELIAMGQHAAADAIENEEQEALPDVPLYTKGVENDGEYRVHVFNGEVILYQKKSRRVDEETGEVITAEGEDADIRNLASNWVYRTGNLNRLERIEELAINAIEALGLDFGAVDIIRYVNGDVFVLEVNTAPGLGNADTLEAYTEAFKSLE